MMATHDDHQQARRLLQLELDGLLGQDEAAWLDAHIAACPGCQGYAAQMRRLDQTLRLDSTAQRAAAANAALTATPAHRLPGSALHTLQNQKRAKMNVQPLKSFANTLVYLVLLAALAGGLMWVLSTQLPSARPSGIAPTNAASPTTAPTPAPTATPTPAPLPEVDTREQIIAALNALAESDAAAYQQTGSFWAYRVAQDLNEAGSGVMNSTFYEQWMHFEGGKCTEMLATARDKPKGERLLNLQVGLPDGTFGDLVALRQGLGQGLGQDVPLLQTGWQCSYAAADTDAGQMARRLETGPEQMQIKGPNTLKTVRAWYETVQERPALVVQAVFTGEAGSMPEVQRETRYFDVPSGQLFNEHIWMEWADGRPLGEFGQSKSLEFLPELPAEVRQLFEQSSAELVTFRDHPPTTATPLPTVTVDILDNLSQYMAASPLTDRATILHVLQALLQRHTAWLAQPGWVVDRPRQLEGRKWDNTYSVLMHVLPDGSCELMTYYIDGERILPQEIRLANGDSGLIGTVQEGVFTEGKRGELPCKIEEFQPTQLLSSNVEMLLPPASGDIDIKLQAWVENRAGQMVLVLYQDTTYVQFKPVTMDPDSQKLEQLDRSELWTFFDLQNGAYAGGADQSYLTNGKTFGDAYTSDAPPGHETLRLDPLPNNLAQVFQQTLAALNEYLAKP